MQIHTRLVFNVSGNPPRLEVMLFGEMLNRLRSAGVVWDLTIQSHGGGDRQESRMLDRLVEVVIYRTDKADTGVETLKAWLDSNNQFYQAVAIVEVKE